MEETKNRFLSAVYQLYSVKDGERTLEEQTSPDRPFEFITGFGIALDALEQKLMKLEKGSTFDFVLQPEEAFGAYEPAGMHKLERDIFMINGKFDHEHIYEGAVITMTDTEDHHFMAQVKKIALDHAKVKEASARDLEVELDKEGSKVYYEVTFEYGGYDYEYEIDAYSGKILHSEKEKDD